MAGLTAEGFVPKTRDEILASIRERVHAELSPALDMSETSVFGKMMGIIADEIAAGWLLAADINTARDPAEATGWSLSTLAAITGADRREATRSTVELTVNLAAGVTLPAGSVVAVDGTPTVRFRTLADVTASALSGLPSNLQVWAECEDTGPVAALATTLTIRVTPVVGWNSSTNADDATLGTEIETDDELRERRTAILTLRGTSPMDAIRVDMVEPDEAADWPGVSYCVVYENTSDVPVMTAGRHLPPHAVEIVILDTPPLDDDVVANRIAGIIAAGVRAYGETLVEVALGGAPGDTRTIGFSRLTEREVYVEVDLVVDPAVYVPDDDHELVRVAVAGVEENYTPGVDVIRSRLIAACFLVPGVLDVTGCRLGFTVSPVGTSNLAITARQVARLSSARVEVATVDGEP